MKHKDAIAYLELIKSSYDEGFKERTVLEFAIECFSKDYVFTEEPDAVQNPDHYKLDGLDPYESIDVIKSVLGDEFKAFCKGNVLKYVIREGKKNGPEDLKKAKVYLDWMLEED